MSIFSTLLHGKNNYIPDFEYPQKVSSKALADLDSAQLVGDGKLAINALVRYGIAKSRISQENLPDIISKIEDVLAKEKRPDYHALLLILEAKIFQDYAENCGSYSRPKATSLDTLYDEWNASDFQGKAYQLSTAALKEKEALRACPIGNYEDIIEGDVHNISQILYPSLYDFVLYQCLKNHYDISAKEAEQICWLKDNGHTEAYIYRTAIGKAQNLDSLYQEYAHNEYSGAFLTQGSTGRNIDKNDSTVATKYALLNDYITRHPKGVYAYQVQEIINAIEAKKISIKYAKSLTSSAEIEMSVDIENTNDYTLKIYEVPSSVLESSKRKYDNIPLKKCNLVRSIKRNVEGTIPFSTHDTVVADPLPYGYYVIQAVMQNEKSNPYYSDVLTVHDLTIISVREANKSGEVLVVNRDSGAPVKGATVKDKKKHFQATTNKDGSVAFSAYSVNLSLSVQNGKDCYTPEFNYSPYTTREDANSQYADIFTDLAIYRPGETVKFAAVCYQTTTSTRTPLSGKKITATLRDANYKTIDTLTLNTDGYGRIEGEFNIPTNRMNGNWRLRLEGEQLRNDKTIIVSEYKTPTFSVEFPDVPSTFNAGSAVKIKGQVMTYSGIPVANTSVKISVNEHAWSWWWRWEKANGNCLKTDTLTTDAEGWFSIELPAQLFSNEENRYSYWHSYSITATVTNAAGETQEESHPFIIGKKRSVEIANFDCEASKNVNIPITFNTTDENEKSVKFNYIITEHTTPAAIEKEGELLSDMPVIDLSDLPSGEYNIIVSLADDPEICNSATMAIYRTTDKTSPVKDCAMWIPTKKSWVDAKNRAHVLIGVSTPQSHIYYIASTRTKVLAKGWLKYAPGMHDFSFEVPNTPDEVLTLRFYNIYNSKELGHSEKFTIKANTQTLKVKATAFRDKLTPGCPETWKFSFVDQNGNPSQGAMLLEMYDKALQSLAANNWNFKPSYMSFTPVAFTSMSDMGINRSQASYIASNRKKEFYVYSDLQLYLYDEEFFPFGRVCDRIMFSCSSKSAPLSLGASNKFKMEEAEMPTGTYSVNDLCDNGATSMESEDKQAKDVPQSVLNNIKLREADVKTALWHPMLTTDGDGVVTLEFNAPEFNTTWIMQAIGYTQAMVTDKIEREVLTQKPIMVKPSLPRFVRSGDKARLKASVMNATNDSTAFTAVVEVFNPRTGEVLATSTVQGNLAAKGSDVVGIDYDVPTTLPYIGFRIKAANETFGDGEQVMLPVIANTSPVIETSPFYIDAEASTSTKTFNLQVDAKNGAKVTLEYCDNPVWYCVTALPTIFEGNYHIATSLAHLLFAEVVAQGVAKSQPQIREAINYWSANAQDSTLTSMLEKNSDLKIGTLIASPWINDAERQTLRMSKLAELFDSEKMAEEHKKITAALKALQRGDGGFPWYDYPGCVSSMWTTHEVLELIGELRHLGYLLNDEEINAILTKALAYYDNKTLKEWNKVNWKKTSAATFSSYAYVRTFFPEFKLDKANDNILKKILKAMSTNWKSGLSHGDKAFYALTLHRNGYQKEAQEIVESLREHAIVKPELGMYWDNIDCGYQRYFDKVAVTSTILQAMAETGAKDVDLVRKWILLMKQTNDWGSNSLAANAVYTLLSTGSNWLSGSNSNAEKPVITWCGKPVEFSKVEGFTGYCRKTLTNESEAQSQQPLTLSIQQPASKNSPAWGAVYMQYEAPMTEIKAHSITELSITKEYVPASGDKTSPLKVGDKVEVRLVIKNNKDLDFVTVTDERASCFEPKDQTSGYALSDRCYYYRETKDSQTNLFFYSLPKGTHIITYEVYVTAEGTFNAGIATAQCQYAPQITAHSAGEQIVVK